MQTSTHVSLVVVMDPIEAIKPAKDSTLAMMLAAQAKGWNLLYAELDGLFLRDGLAWTRVAPIRVFDDPKHWFERGEYQRVGIAEYVRRRVDAQRRIKDDPQGLADPRSIVDAHVQARIVGAYRAAVGADRGTAGAPMLHIDARGFRRE